MTKNYVTLVYIGEKFYRESASAMSSFYTTGGDRYDLSNLVSDLEEGAEINIRPATNQEFGYYQKVLDKLKK